MKRVSFDEIDGTPYAQWWRERFEPETDIFAGMRFYQRGRANIWVGTADITGLSATRMDAVGIHLLRISRRIWKPTSTAIVAFGHTARANALELDAGEARAFLAGADINMAPEDPRYEGLSRGFITARYAGVALGCAEWHQRGTLASLIPKSQRVSHIDL